MCTVFPRGSLSNGSLHDYTIVPVHQKILGYGYILLLLPSSFYVLVIQNLHGKHKGRCLSYGIFDITQQIGFFWIKT